MISRANHTLLILIVALIAGTVVKAQAFKSNYNFQHLNVQNGLTQNIVYHFLQDSRGYMWIGTQNGLSLFDGVKTTNFLHEEGDSTSIGGNFISSILEDSSQQIWIGNENGIDRYNRINNTFSHFGVDRANDVKDKTYCVLLGFVSSNELWFLDTKTRSVRSFHLQTSSTSFISELKATNALLYKGRGQKINIWSSYDKGTIHQVYNNKKIISQQTYFSGKNGAIDYPDLVVSHVLQQNDTTIWLSTNGGLVRLNPLSNKYQLFNRWQNQAANEFRYAAISPKGQLWLGCGPAGLYLFDINTSEFTENFRNNKLDPLSICSDNIVSVYFDKMGNLWCGSYGNGSSYAHVQNLFFSSHISKNETRAWESNNHISWIGTDANGHIWCMLADMPGFWILDKDLRISAHKKLRLEDGSDFIGYTTKVLFDGNENLWCATNKGLFQYNIASGRMRQVNYPLLSEEVQGSIWIKDMIRLHDSSIIFSTYVGLYRMTVESGKPTITPISVLKPGEYNGFGLIFEDQANVLYVKSLAHFLYVLKANEEGKYDLIKSIPFIPEVNQFYREEGDSVIYIATMDGVYKIDSKNFHVEKKHFNHGPPFTNVSMVFKKANQLWVFGEKGLYLFDDKSEQGRTYTIEDGLPANEFSLSSLVVTPDQRCIAGTANGLVSFYPNHLQDSLYSPIAQLTGIYINDALHTLSPGANEIQKLQLSFRQNTLAFDFSTIAFQHPSECQFEYMLEGYDQNWISSGLVKHTRYSKIPPGNYVFRLRVNDAMGRTSPFVKAVDIEISRAFWQTSFFKVVILAFILSMGWLISRWYFRLKIRKQTQQFEKQQAIEKERTRIATDMHDDLGAGLSRIKFLSQSILNKKLKDDVIRTELEKITSFSDEMSEKMGEIVWALSEKNDTLADLIAYTRSYAVEYLANHDIECEANTPLHLPGTFLTGEMRRNIFLSVKECLHNIVKHAEATKVCFSIHLDDKMRIVIHDNGRGIDWEHRRAFSNGIQNIENRMQEVKGEVNFTNEQGTKVSLVIPLIL